MNLMIRVLLPYMYQTEKILFLHGLARKAHLRGLQRVSVLLEGFILQHYGCAISSKAKIGKRFRMGHPIGIVIGAGVIIEDDVVIYQHTTVGSRRIDGPRRGAFIGRGTVVYANSVIIGDVLVGEECVIGACSFLDHDLPAKSIFKRGDSHTNFEYD
jgi:serine acetyltransferase